MQEEKKTKKKRLQKQEKKQDLKAEWTAVMDLVEAAVDSPGIAF